MEESWINLNVQQTRSKQPPSQHEDETDEVISAPSTTSSTSTSSSTSSLEKQRLASSGSTDENLSASFGTLLRKGEIDPTAVPRATTSPEDTDKERRDTITANERPKGISAEKRRARQRRRTAKVQAINDSFWHGFYVGMTFGFSSMILGFACWRLSLRLRLVGAHV